MSTRCVYMVMAVLALTVGYSCWCRTPLIWDGAYQFNSSLILDFPYFYLSRFHTYILWWPTVWAGRFTTNVMVLQSLYGLPFLAAPVLAVGLSWWMVHRDAPHLLVWAIFGVCAGTLPGQIFIINDSIFQIHLFWPIFLSLFVRLSWPKKITIAILSIFQFVHPLGIVLFLLTAVVAIFIALVDRTNRRRLLLRAGVFAALFALATGKIYVCNLIPRFYDDYAIEQATWSTALNLWRVSVRGWPLHGLWFLWSAAVMLLVWERWPGRLCVPGLAALSILLSLTLGLMVWAYRRQPIEGIYSEAAILAFFLFMLSFRRAVGPPRIAALLPLLCAAAGSACLIHWAGDGHLWWKAIDYRRWAGPLTTPFLLLAAMDGFAESRSRNTGTSVQPAISRSSAREPLAQILVSTFALVIGLQSTIWHVMTGRLMSVVEHCPTIIVPESAVPWTAQSPLDHWATGDYVMAMEGKQPAKLLLSPIWEQHIYEDPPKFPHWDFYPNAKKNHPDPTPREHGWYELRPLLEKIKREPRRTGIDGPHRLDLGRTPE